MVGIPATFARSAEVPRIKKDELKAMLGNSDLVILDVRYKKDWTDSDSKIQGAIREDPDSVKSWAEKYSKDKTFVLYCA
jgi:rhodanese-related sulfurtransferase